MQLEISFLNKYISNNIIELFHQEIETFPDFFIQYYKTKIANKLIDQINRFKADFATATEEEWIVFIREERKSMNFWENKSLYKPKDLDMSALRAALSLLVVMPIKKDIKHEWHIIETKISRIQKDWGISPELRCSW